jgi:hypothetical protein
VTFRIREDGEEHMAGDPCILINMWGRLEFYQIGLRMSVNGVAVHAYDEAGVPLQVRSLRCSACGPTDDERASLGF